MELYWNKVVDPRISSTVERMMIPGLGSLLSNFEKFDEHKERLRTASHDRGLDKNVACIIIVAWIDY